MAFAAGAATFNSCNKAGSIVQFTDHLRMYPNDYNALMWRSRAYGIVGQPQNALRDIEHAISVSSGIRREVATAHKLRYTNVEDYGAHVKRTVKTYPNEWSAWERLASYNSWNKDEDAATDCNMKSLELAAKYNETRDPLICWVNYEVGNYWYNKANADTAKGFYEAAIQSSPTHTVSHIGLCQCNICQGNTQAAKQNFQTANSLNPNLASQVFKTESFEVYYSNSTQHNRQQSASASYSGSRNTAGRQAGAKTGGGTGGGARGGSGGGGNGSGSDNDDEDVSAIWKRLQRQSPSIKLYKKHKYVQSTCGNYWYSRDTAGHGRDIKAQFKRYENTRSTLVFKDSLDANFRPMSSKHESQEGTIIRKCDMIGVK